MSSRLQSREDKLLLLDYLVSELMASRMVSVDCPKEKQGVGMNIVVVSVNFNEELISILFNVKAILNLYFYPLYIYLCSNKQIALY